MQEKMRGKKNTKKIGTTDKKSTGAARSHERKVDARGREGK
jgi:hypothetical protein